MTATRLLLCITLALVPQLAWADEPAPTKEQLDAAKKAFDAAKVLYDAGRYPEAIEKLRESYKLSRNPGLLYNLGHAYDQAGQKDKALAFYLKFLANAPANAPMRAEAKKRADELDKENVEPDLGTKPTPEPPVAKPTGTYTAADFHHQVVEAVPPGKPVDVVASVPRDAGFTLVLFYRGANDGTFTSAPMTWRNQQELVARIPADKIAGTSIQYYVEVKDKAGALVTRSGKSTSPNLINIDANAAAHFDPGEGDMGSLVTRPDREDPLLAAKPAETHDDEPARPSSVRRSTLIATSAAVALTGGTVVMYFLAKGHSDKLLEDAKSCGTPPCRQFDAMFDQQTQADGQRENTIYRIGMGVSIATAAVAAYLWFRDLTSKHTAATTARANAPEPALAVAPVFGDDFAGAAAAARF